MKVIEVKNLSKKYKNLEVIKDISFSIEEGETLVILGASGSGKSTILRCINNLEKKNKKPDNQIQKKYKRIQYINYALIGVCFLQFIIWLI